MEVEPSGCWAKIANLLGRNMRLGIVLSNFRDRVSYPITQS